MVRTVAVLSALQKESLAFFELGGEEPFRRRGVELAVREVSGVRVVAANGGMGKVNSAASAQLLIDAYEPDALIFSGIARRNPQIGEGDVVVGARLECLDADMQIVAESEPHLDFPSSAGLVRLAEQELEARGFARVKPVASLEDANASAAAYGTLAPYDALRDRGHRYERHLQHGARRPARHPPPLPGGLRGDGGRRGGAGGGARGRAVSGHPVHPATSAARPTRRSTAASRTCLRRPA